MLKKIPYLITLAAITSLFTACEKVIDVDISESPNQLVIEGNITDIRQMQTIKINTSVPYTDNNVYPAVSNAIVTVTDNAGNSWTPAETQPGVYTFGPMQGITDRVYTLNVQTNGKTYEAQSTMPAPVQVDSIGIVKLTFGSSETKVVAVYYKDPKGVPNQYRYIMKVNGTITRRVYTADDRLTDGNNVKDQLFFSSDDDNEEINSGDKVDVETQCVDRAVYKYFFTLSEQSQNGPGGGVTPSNPPSNISNGALGYFSAHTVQQNTLTVQE